MKKVTFTLARIMTISTTVWFFSVGLLIAVGYFGIKVFLGDILKIFIFANNMSALTTATGIMLLGLGLRKINEKQKVVIEIIDEKEIVIYFNDKIKIASPVSELQNVFSIHPVNKKPDVQAELIFKQGTINLYGAGNYKNKKEFDNFLLFLEKKLHFKYIKAPFSLRWSKHYVKYTNPL